MEKRKITAHAPAATFKVNCLKQVDTGVTLSADVLAHWNSKGARARDGSS